MSAEEVLDIGSRLELFVDEFLIGRLDGARLELQRPQPAGMAVAFDAPWEGLFAGCITVIQDADRFLMYYRGMPEAQKEGRFDCACLATSPDGVNWEKPTLGLFEYDGSRDNNIVLCGQRAVTHNFCPFLDQRPGVPEEQRFKAVGGTHPDGIFAYASPDGIHWAPMQNEPILTAEVFAFDSQNVAFWSEAEQCYVCYFRTWRQAEGGEGRLGYRWISRATSEDFLDWSEFAEMDAGDAPWEQTYTQQTHPYYRAPHLYIALAARFWPRRKVVSDEQARKIGVHPDYCHDCSDGILMTSRGGNRYDQTFLESFMRPGPGLNHWVSRTNYPALGVVPTGPGEMSMYAHRNYASPTAHAARCTLRVDGFASVNAPYAGGELRTKPLRFAGDALVINYSTSAAGGIRCEIQDPDGRPVPGHSLEDADEIIGDEIERVVSWQGGTDVAALVGKPVRLRFAMKDADLFSIRFR